MKKIKGMTFIEVVIAIVIVGIVLSGMLTCLNFASKYAVYNANKTEAIYLAQGSMEEKKNVSYGELSETEGYDEAGNPCKLVSVLVYWTCEGETHSDAISTRRYNY